MAGITCWPRTAVAAAAPTPATTYAWAARKKVTGPFLDNKGVDMIQGGGKLLIGSGGRVVGAGHFGLLDLGDGVQKFSMHWEADLDRGGASVLDIRPLLWKDGWPVAGENLKEGTYEIESVRTGTALELAVEGMPVGGRARQRGGGAGLGAPGGRGRWTRRPSGTGRWSPWRRRPGTRRPVAGGRRNVRRHGQPDSAAGCRGGLEELARRQHRRPHGKLPVSGPAEVGDYSRPQRRRLPRLAVFQDHHRRHGPCAGRHRGR